MNQTAATVDCKHEPAVFAPVINRNRCEGKEDCVRVCPYSVFEVRKLTTDERRAIPFLARLKMTLHGDKQAFAGPRPGLPRVRIVRSCVPGTRDHTGARRETCLEQNSFVFTKYARGFWMPACAGMTRRSVQECHSRESGNPGRGKFIATASTTACVRVIAGITRLASKSSTAALARAEPRWNNDSRTVSALNGIFDFHVRAAA